jgi:hypothetical protein
MVLVIVFALKALILLRFLFLVLKAKLLTLFLLILNIV